MKIEICKTWFSKFRGLMFSKKKNLLFVFKEEKTIAIHMFFVFFSINIIYFDKNKKETARVKAYPFTILKPRKAKYILETTEAVNRDDISHILGSVQ